MSDAARPCSSDRPSVDGLRNLRLFFLFRVFFNCRFYYPVYAILFTDLGLTTAQFALLNGVWAASIVLLEVPSGALADQFGRRTLVVAAAVLMVCEMLVLALAPVGSPGTVFWCFLVNRLLSGAAEAAASGADEALAYDSLPENDRDAIWSKANARLMHWMSAGFIFATITGAIAYSPGPMNALAAALGWDGTLTSQQTVKFPVYLTLATALATLAIAVRFREPPRPADDPRPQPVADAAIGARIAASFRTVLETARWIATSSAPLVLILIGILIDSVIRVFYTVSSRYYRLLEIDTAYYGVIGAAGSVVGFAAAALVEPMHARLAPRTNFGIVAALALVGLVSLAFPVALWGVLFVIPLWLAMRMLHYFLSQHLNRVTDSRHRATVLSFRGLSLNLAYLGANVLFGLQTAALSRHLFGSTESRLPEGEVEIVFAHALQWWAPWFAATIAAFLVFVRLRFGRDLNSILSPPRQPEDRRH